LFELSLAAFTASFLLLVLAEMGDKTQLVAMSFAACYNLYKVLLAIFIAVVVNFAIVISIGEFLTTIIPIDIISFAASISFIGFGLWTARDATIGEKGEEKIKVSRFGVVATVAITFFIAEFGDKTQLATLSIAAQYQNPISVLIGATLAMLVADGLGIFIGVVLCRHIPQRAIKWFSAAIFVIFGLVGVYEVLSMKIGLIYSALVLVVLIAISVVITLILGKRRRTSEVPFELGVCKEKLQKEETKT
jgi:Ca2+/H+ antiporter, TMEM165/GDT1 family